MKFKNSIKNLVEAMELKKGEIVLLQFWGENEDLDILDTFAIEVGRVGAIPIKWQYSREFLKDYFTEISETALEFPKNFFEIFNVADTVIDICMYRAPQPHTEFPKEKIRFYQEYMKELFSILMNKEKFIQIRVPTLENAKDSILEFNKYEEYMNYAYMVDYKELKSKCDDIIKGFKDKNNIKIFTGENNELSFRINERQWFKDDGTGDFPSGEVYIAPLEDSANGKILIPLIECNGELLKDVVLTFESGKVIQTSSDSLFEFISSLPEGSSTLCEFGIGLNDKINNIVGYSLLDEKANGTIHIGIGMNLMFGGKNQAPFHMDFVCIPKNILSL